MGDASQDLGMVLLADKLHILRAVEHKLLRSRHPAAAMLVTALEEVYKFYLAIDAEFTRYFALSFDPSQTETATTLRDTARRELMALEGGKPLTRIFEGRGHCHKIGLVYDEYLRPWFSTVLDSEESVKFRGDPLRVVSRRVTLNA